jgi:hypothetical protein
MPIPIPDYFFKILVNISERVLYTAVFTHRNPYFHENNAVLESNIDFVMIKNQLYLKGIFLASFLDDFERRLWPVEAIEGKVCPWF